MIDTIPLIQQFSLNPYLMIACEALLPLRDQVGRLEVRLHPDANNVSIAALGTYEGRSTVPPNSRLWGISASSDQPEGFQAQIRDNGSGQMIFSKQTYYASVAGGANGSPMNPVFLLPRPFLFGEPSQVVVQVWNRSPNPNSIQILLWFACEAGLQNDASS